METKKNVGRWRPKKDFWELKEKINKEAAENKWKLGRGRPRKIAKVEVETAKQSTTTWFSSKSLDNEKFRENLKIANNESKAETLSKNILYFCIIFFIISIAFFYTQKIKSNTNSLKISEINIQTENDNNDNTTTNEQIPEIIVETQPTNENLQIETLKDIVENEKIESDDPNIVLIKNFYENLNNKDFDAMRALADKFLKSSDSFRTYYSTNRLTRFLNKIHENRIYVTWIKQVPYEKENVSRYIYDIKYIQNSDQKLYQEQRQVDIVNRNWTNLIWSIMCITTWCSKMPFFQP